MMDPFGITLMITAMTVTAVAALLSWVFFSSKKWSTCTVAQQEVKIKNHPVSSLVNEMRTQILFFRDNLRNDDDQLGTIRKVQALLISTRNEIGDDFGTQNSLIIGVDATPYTQAGYCVNPFDKSIRFYVLKREDFPWKFENERDPAEFEMKNLMFALTVWRKQVAWFKHLSIYTDNFAVTGEFGSIDGYRASQYLQHFVRCEGVNIVNHGKIAVNKYRSLQSFAKYIQPADDLSRWKLDAALKFLTRMYDIDMRNVKGTHLKTLASSFRLKPWYEPMPFYKRIVDSANRGITKGLRCGNPVCSTALTFLVNKKER